MLDETADVRAAASARGTTAQRQRDGVHDGRLST